MLATPFEIGDIFWLPSTSPRRVTEPCPVCAGDKRVTVVTGAGGMFTVECDACGLGYEGPQGTVEEYHHDPGADAFTIARVTRMDEDDWTVESTQGQTARFDSLCYTEQDAMAVSVKTVTAHEEENMRRKSWRRKGVGKAAWTVRYHTDAIKKLERELAYHRSKIGK